MRAGKKINRNRYFLFSGFLAAAILLAGIYFQAPIRRGVAEAFFRKGNNYFSGQNYNLDKSQFFYESALKIYPQAQGPHYQMARIYFLRGDFLTAIKEINVELANFPDFKRSYYVRGLINGYAKNFPSAISDFQEFLKWDSQSWAAHNDLAWIYFQTGDYKKAEEVARAGLEYDSENPWLLNSLGVALLNLEKTSEAKGVLEKALLAVQKLTPADWQRAYPGNGPAFSADGLQKMTDSIRSNLGLTKGPVNN